MTLAAGSRLGPYEIVSPLGAGGMGEAYNGLPTPSIRARGEPPPGGAKVERSGGYRRRKLTTRTPDRVAFCRFFST